MYVNQLVLLCMEILRLRTTLCIAQYFGDERQMKKVSENLSTSSKADRVYVSLGTAGTYPGYGPVYRNVPW